MKSGISWWGPVASVACALLAQSSDAIAGPHDALVAKHAAAHGVPESLVRRVIHIESKGNARVVSKGNYGLMQIRLGTAKAMGYRGTAEGLLDADTNMTYAVKYLALAYRAAGCSESGAVGYYQRGFYKRPRGKCAAPREATTQIAKVEPARQGGQRATASDGEAAAATSAEVLTPRAVQVQKITRPKSVAQFVAQPVAPQTAAAQPPAAPMQVALAPAPRAPVAPQPVVSAPAVQPSVPQAVPSAQTVARAPEYDAPATPQAPQVSPALPTVFMELLPMPKPRPAKAPRAVANLDVAVSSEPARTSDVSGASPDLPVAKLDPAATEPPMLMPRPRPAKAPRAVAKLDAAVSSEPARTSDVSAASPDLPVAKLDPAATETPMPKPRPATAPQAVAKLDAAVVSEPSPKGDASPASPDEAATPSADVQVARLDPAAVPLPQPKPALDVAPADESKQARRKSQQHTRVARKRAPQQQESGLVTFLRNLTTPQQTARRRR